VTTVSERELESLSGFMALTHQKQEQHLKHSLSVSIRILLLCWSVHQTLTMQQVMNQRSKVQQALVLQTRSQMTWRVEEVRRFEQEVRSRTKKAKLLADWKLLV
jgi:hypothetical protein